MARKHEIEIIARGLLIERGQLLLCRNVEKNYRYLPGGHVEFGESAASALAREFLEETGAKVRVGALLLSTEGVFRRKARLNHEINLVFHVERLSGGEIESLEPKIAFDWVSKRGLSATELRPRLLARWLRMSDWTRVLKRPQEWISDFA